MLATELYQRVRRRLDIEPGSYLDDNEIGQVCAEQYLELWDLLHGVMGDEAPWERVTLSTTPNSDTLNVSLATGVHRIVRVDFLGPGGIYDPVMRFELGDESLDDNARTWVSARSFRYAARRSQRAANSQLAGLASAAFSDWRLHFSPKPAGAYSLRITYLPPPRIIMATNPSAPPAVTYSEFPDEFPEYVVAGAAAVFAAKQETDDGPFIADKKRITEVLLRYYKPMQLTQARMVLDMRAHQLGAASDDMDFQNRGRVR